MGPSIRILLNRLLHPASAVSVLFAALVLGGCGAESTPQAPARSHLQAQARPPAQAAAARDERPLIIAFGDSLTAGYGIQAGQSYPDFLQAEIDRRGLAFRVINEGVSGDTTATGLTRLEGVAAQLPAVVIVEFGGNDGLRALPVDQMKRNLATMVSRLQEAGAQVVLAGVKLPLNYGPEYRQAFEDVYTNLSREFGVPLIPFLLDSLIGVPGMMQPDGIHPTVEGNVRVAATVMAAIEPQLEKRAAAGQ
jgi:acyl-CoA thioesterase-1